MFPKYVLLPICAFIRVHFGRLGKSSQHSPFRGIHIFFQKLVMISEFFQRKVGSHLFSKACWFFSLTTYFSFFFFFSLFSYLLSFFFPFFICLFLFLVCFFFHEVFCYLNMCIFLWGIFAIYMHIQGILPPKHTYICFVRYFFATYTHI